MYMVAAQGWCPWCGGHMGWGGGLMMILFWLVALAVIVWAVQVIVRGRGVGGEARQGRAESLLDERYARGEIDEATHRRMLEELRR